MLKSNMLKVRQGAAVKMIKPFGGCSVRASPVRNVRAMNQMTPQMAEMMQKAMQDPQARA
jgi:hypothetical protein